MIQFNPGSGGGYTVQYLIGDYWHTIGGLIREPDGWKFRHINGLPLCLPGRELIDIADKINSLNDTSTKGAS